MSKETHSHIDSNGNVIIHTHEMGEKKEHGHYHSPDEKKRWLNRIAKATGHLNYVKKMIDNDEDCSDVLVQLSAVEAALHNLGKEIISEHLTHCISHAIEDNDSRAIEAFRESIKKFL